MAEDHYKTLGINRYASADDIQKAYRDLARKYHPDLHPDDKAAKQKFQQVQSAFEVLNDHARREQYDHCLSPFELRRAHEERGRRDTPANRDDDLAAEAKAPFGSTILGGAQTSERSRS